MLEGVTFWDMNSYRVLGRTVRKSQCLECECMHGGAGYDDPHIRFSERPIQLRMGLLYYAFVGTAEPCERRLILTRIMSIWVQRGNLICLGKGESGNVIIEDFYRCSEDAVKLIA